jgi:hypothetical protein
MSTSVPNTQTIVATKMYDRTYTKSNEQAANGINGYVFTKNAQISFDIEMVVNPTAETSPTPTGWWPTISFSSGWRAYTFQFCSWKGNVNVKNNIYQGMSAANLLSNGATRTDNGDGTFTWKLSVVIKADENGYVAMYNSTGTKLFTSQNVGVAFKFDMVSNIFFGVGAESTYAGGGTVAFNNVKVSL